MADPNDLIRRLADALGQYTALGTVPGFIAPLIREARDYLAQPDQEEPTDEELLELLSRASGLPEPDSYTIDGGRIISEPSEILGFARAVLQQWGRPAIQGEEQ